MWDVAPGPRTGRPDTLARQALQRILGCGAFGGLLGAAVTKTIANRAGAGMAYVAGCFAFTVPLVLVLVLPLVLVLVLVPLAPVPRGHGTDPVILLMPLGAEFLSGFEVMVLDIAVGSIFATVIPDAVRSRVTGAFTAINYGTRPVGALLGGVLGRRPGCRPGCGSR